MLKLESLINCYHFDNSILDYNKAIKVNQFHHPVLNVVCIKQVSGLPQPIKHDRPVKLGLNAMRVKLINVIGN